MEVDFGVVDEGDSGGEVGLDPILVVEPAEHGLGHHTAFGEPMAVELERYGQPR